MYLTFTNYIILKKNYYNVLVGLNFFFSIHYHDLVFKSSFFFRYITRMIIIIIITIIIIMMIIVIIMACISDARFQTDKQINKHADR